MVNAAKKLSRPLIATLLIAVSMVTTVYYQLTMNNRNQAEWLYTFVKQLMNHTLQQLPIQNPLAPRMVRLNEHFAALRLYKPELPSVNKTGRYVSMCSGNFDSRRFGNQLFNFAGMLKVADLTGRRVAMILKHPYGWLDQVFEVPITRVRDIQKELCPCVDVGEDSIEKLAQRQDLVNKSLLICGWWQSWKYTEGVETQLRYYLRFRPEISNKVNSFFNKSYPRHWPKNVTPFRVGIHVRAGDLMSKTSFDFGYTIPKAPYFEKAMSYVINDVARPSRPNNDKILVHFYVTSDSIDWVKSSLGLTSIASRLVNGSVNEYVHVTYSTSNSAAVDLALLSRCDAVIMTTGTYGWWAGWLSNKTTVYFNDWPRPGSPLTGAINRAGFFPPWWVSFSGPFYTFIGK